MSWLSQKIKNGTLTDITVESSLRALPAVGDVIANEVKSHKVESTISAARHLAQFGADAVRREMEASGVSELEAIANLVKRADARNTGLRILLAPQNLFLIFVALVGLALFLRGRK